MRQWQMDFKDASSVPAQLDGKRQHVVEVLNAVDRGTSVLVEAQVRADFSAETTLQEVASLLRTHGRPQQLTFDRDVRFVSSPQGSDFLIALGALLSLPGRGGPDLRSAPSPAKRVSCILHSFRIVSVFLDICGHTFEERAHRAAGRPPSHDHSSETWEALLPVPRP